ncbi:ring-cleaving dioxygenase [Isobaculum melis]|uniref:Glyoxalase family protein n=1 Tax=Isobaculum melis TaxID=142588 RepID=A0A1H9U813_9LACT|nr:ring-cleaving dioxygenase [Isobaculum melis]SES05462.1 glyoxalase family protein [Isobaculum melis]
MKKQTMGIHHISAIVGNPQENVDFYGKVLGLRLVKQTVNFDDPGTYHLYFGNGLGSPGTIITFFPWAGAYPGKVGDGQVGITAYAIPIGALTFWEQRLQRLNIETKRVTRFNETSLQFDDPHGLHLELVERAAGAANDWIYEDITPSVAIKGFAGATLYSAAPVATKDVLENLLGLTFIAEEDSLMRFRSTGDIGNIIDLKQTSMGQARMGVGTVHHIAWRAIDDQDQVEWQELAQDAGQYVTEIKDRNYFKAVYFREPGQILFEIATDSPGFAHDESLATMGEKLMLPAQYEHLRAELTQKLIPIQLPKK